MGSDVVFPLYGFAKDDRSMWLVESQDRILYHMESIDIANGEYLLWDATGRAVQISVKGKQAIAAYTDCEMLLAEAFKQYAEAYGLNADTTGPADEVWHRLKDAETRLPRKRGIFSRLFHRRDS